MTINNNNIFGAFTLGEVRSGRLTGDWLNVESVANYGWFGGGAINTLAVLSTVDRIDFSNDSVTATPRGALSLARVYPAATGNSNYGWFCSGGDLSVYYSLVDRVDFSNDSATASVRGPLTSTRYGLAATANSNYGWFGGGRNAALLVPIAAVERIDFSNDSTTASLRGPLSSSDPLGPQIYGSAATANSNYGWFGGGYAPFPPVGDLEISTVYRIDFSNDLSPASVRGPLSSARGYAGATGNSNYGWFGGGGGLTPAPSTVVSRVDRIDFSNDSSTASVRGPLTLSRNVPTATGNSNYGWFGGGLLGLGPPIALTSRVDRIDFSNDSVTALTRGSLTSENVGNNATSGVLNIRRQKAGNFGSYGWFGGGSPVPGGFSATVDRITFANDSVTALARAPLFAGHARTASTGNSNYGWWIGGRNGAPIAVISTISRIDFSNDSVTASVARGSLSAAKYQGHATGNSDYGWFGGSGSGLVNTSSVERIDFSNDLSATRFRGPFLTTKDSADAVSTYNYGWFGGGATITTVDRIDFANDSSTPLTKGSLITARYGLAGSANSNYGWFAGGTPGANTPLNVVERIDFSNDSATALTRGVLSLVRYRLTSAGNSNYGWFGGGFNASFPGGARSRVDRIDFSNDSVTASPRSPLSAVKYALGAVSNTTVG
jgi:hypothetical protein